MTREYSVTRSGDESDLNASEYRAQLESEGYSVFQWSDSAGSTYSTHSHAEDQSHWIISGKLELNVEGVGVVLLEAGDRDFMPAGTDHSARVVGNEAVVYLIGSRRK